MHVVRFLGPDGVGVGVMEDGVVRRIDVESVAALLSLRLADIREVVGSPGQVVTPDRLLPPVDGRTEVWASGVTYKRSREARMEESSQKDVYELVYDADRPELFFKSVAWRVVGDHDNVGIRSDSSLDVPEPELGVVVNAHGEVAGYVVCNDMSSRSIEGENPLYLPQAKIYAGSCAMSSGIRPAWEVDGSELAITMTVSRSGETVFSGSTSTSRLHRTIDDLVGYLFRAERFPEGAVLSTGTGIVPEVTFTLQAADEIAIEIADVGSLTNRVVVGPDGIAYPGLQASTVV